MEKQERRDKQTSSTETSGSKNESFKKGKFERKQSRFKEKIQMPQEERSGRDESS
jgi:hypothetical protein